MGYYKIGKLMNNMMRILLRSNCNWLARVKCERDGEEGRETLGMGNCSVNI